MAERIRLKRKPIWKISVATLAEAEEPVADLLNRIFGLTASSYFNCRTGTMQVAVYLPNAPGRLPEKLARMRTGLRVIRSWGVNLGSGHIRCKRIPDEDWAESWKRHFPVLEFGRTLRVQPSWMRAKARPGQAVLVLDPGLSFGTGQHPTTAFCLRQLIAWRTVGTAQSFLDIGTGSGILALAAVKVGYAPVHAFDFDAAAVRIAKANARANGLAGKLKIYRADVAKLPAKGGPRYSLICANLVANLLLVESPRIVSRLEPGGHLVVAGILEGEFPLVQRCFERCGLELESCAVKRQWRSATFAKR